MIIEKISESLERIFRTFIDEDSPSNFFTHLGDYVNYILETPQLRVVIDKEMKRREREYEKEDSLEKRTTKELREVKSELLKVVKQKNISPDKLQGEWSVFLVDSGTILDELELFENGKIHTSTPHSNQLSRYLSEIAVGISKQGYEKELQKFIDPEPHIKNIYGNFIFSKTLKEREGQTERIEIARQFELWGCFEELIRFQKAFFEASQNSNYLDVFNKHSKNGKYRIDNEDAAKITHMSEELKEMLRKKHHGQKLSISYLNIENYKNFVKRTHNHLLKEFTKEDEKIGRQSENKSIIIDFQKGIYSTKNPKLIYEISGKRLDVIKCLSKKAFTSGADLIATTGQNDSLLSKEIKKINTTFNNKLKIKGDLIVNSKTGGGYKLNKSEFIIKTLT